MTTPALTPEAIADRVRANLVAFGGRQGFLADPGGWLDQLLADQPHTAAVDEAAKQAIDLIVADHEESKVPETAEEMVTELRDEWGIVDAYVMDPGPGTVHIPVPDGSVFLSDSEGSHPDPARPLGHVIGRCYLDGRDEIILWEDPQARSTSGALGQLAAEANKVSGRIVELTDLLDGNTATVTADQAAATVRGWYDPAAVAAYTAGDDIAERDLFNKADEFQAALLAGDQVAAADIAGEIAVGFDLHTT